MGIDYNAVLYYGKVVQRTIFSEDELAEYGFYECLEDYVSKYEGLSFVVLGYDEEKQAVIGKDLSYVGYYKDYEKVELPTKEERERIDKLLEEKCAFISCLSIS